MTYQPRPPRRHVAHFLDTVRWAGATIRDDGGRLTVHGDATGLLQVEVDRRAAAIRAWWQQQAEQQEEVTR
jgi:hypothetical protein